jgi:N-acetylglucosaminyldiphosphoundecaprenol N-acetyl-beta-D-mannosaminyltransferase
MIDSFFRRHVVNRVEDTGIKKSYYNFAGVGIEALTYEEMIDRVDRWLENKEGRSHHIACINAYCVALAIGNSRLRKIYNQSDLAGADGMPFVKWIKRAMKAECDRFAAPDIAHYLAEKSESKKYSFYLYGGAPEVLPKMAKYLKEKYPHINIVGSYSPPFRPLTEIEDSRICDEINRLRPDIVLVGLGTPKQDYWIDEHVEKIRGSVFIASGATFDFFGGRIKMAPAWIRKSGFEWAYRLLSKDFLRLWRRYTIMNMIFLWSFLLQLLGREIRQPNIQPRPE